MPKFPDNLSKLHTGEEGLAAKSISIIESSEDTSAHIAMIENCMDLFQYVRGNTPNMTEDQLIIALLGASVFNSIASALKLILSGYYQASGLQMRYVLETGWLIDYFTIDSREVQKWKSTPEDKRQNTYRPALVRERLDKRDGLSSKKREAHYKQLCVLCGHPSFAGFNMLRPQPESDAHMGPFLVAKLLEQCVQELVMCTIVAWEAFMKFFPPNSLSDHKARLKSLEVQAAWYENTYERKWSDTYLIELRKIISALEAQG